MVDKESAQFAEKADRASLAADHPHRLGVDKMSEKASRVEPGHGAPLGRRLHPVPIRVMHWINAAVIMVMITSGWGIYDDDVIIHGLYFNSFFRLGDWAAWSLNWHLAGMWFFAINGLIYLIYGLTTGRFRERLYPIRPKDLVHTVAETLQFKFAHEDLTVYNAVQKLLYVVVILACINQVVTGIAIWKPVQFSGLVSLFGGFQSARVFHFTGMVVIVGFLVVHVLLALIVPKTIWAMLAGGPRLKPAPEIRAARKS